MFFPLSVIRRRNHHLTRINRIASRCLENLSMLSAMRDSPISEHADYVRGFAREEKRVHAQLSRLLQLAQRCY